MKTQPIPFMNEEETRHFLKAVNEETRKNQQKGVVAPFIPVAARALAASQVDKSGVSIINLGSV